MKKLALLLCLFFNVLCAQDISGFWKSINEETRKAQCIVAIYAYEGLYYGRIIGTFDGQGNMKESIYKPKERAPGVIGNPYYCGLDIIWNLEDKGISYKGKILDPEKGTVYNSELWIENDNLVVRGKLLFFGRNQTWFRAVQADFPQGFKMPDLKSLIPMIPQVK
jgi:hypothetical protein